jgi:hypothetical protein
MFTNLINFCEPFDICGFFNIAKKEFPVGLLYLASRSLL